MKQIKQISKEELRTHMDLRNKTEKIDSMLRQYYL